MLRLRTLPTRSLAPAALCALVVAACGGSQRPAATTSSPTALAATTSANAKGKTLYIYSGLPLSGAQKSESLQIEQGIRFALAGSHYKVGPYQIKYIAQRDSGPQRTRRHGRTKVVTRSQGWSPAATVAAAEKAARNPQTVAYIGDLDSGATELSLPILNQAEIAQLTPGSGYPGLTDRVPDVTLSAPPPEPGRYYPQGRGSLMRLIPNDVVQAAAAVDWLKKYPSCHMVAAAQFGTDTTSTAMVRAIEATAKLYKLGFLKTPPPTNDTKTYATYGADLRTKGVNCFVLAGPVTPAAVAFTNELQAQLPPGSVILGTSSVCNTHWTDPARGGVSAKVDASLYCTTPVLRVSSYPGGKHFSAIFSARHRAPTAYTYWGYVAGSLLLKAINEIGAPDTRRAVMSNLITTGTFDSDGDLWGNPGSAYGLDKVVKGIPRPYEVLRLQPEKLLQES